ncbi:MAG TPA: PEP-CTERM sorting domain-containing protein [Casimicrobiaceae bacterium]|jgi:hypothetical protein|nr:PEP-CTERM sorting domain-containing protein [Casimicrobiaceae bacterium]
MNLLTKLILAALWLTPMAAKAQTACATDPATGTTICDPTSFHVTSPTATGSDPVLLNDADTFTITEVGNHSIDDPIRVYFIQPLGAVLPTITGATGIGPLGAFTIGPTLTATAQKFDAANGLFDGVNVTIASGQDFGKQIGLGDASVSFANFAAEYAALGLALPTTFQVEDALFNVPGGGFDSDADFLTVNGSFSKGTIIAPLAVDLSIGRNGKLNVTAFDTSWTNAAIVNTLAGPPVPEPRTWMMMLVGFGLLGLMGRRWSAHPSSSPTG